LLARIEKSAAILLKRRPLAEPSRLNGCIRYPGHIIQLFKLRLAVGVMLAISKTRSAGSLTVALTTSARKIDANPSEVKMTSASSGDMTFSNSERRRC
jgi:hypothetical protein